MKDYEKALSIAEAWYKNTAVDGNTKRVLEKIFPELKETMDEKIIEALIEFFKVGAENNEATCKIPDKDILAWVERIKKSGSFISPDLKKFIGNKINVGELRRIYDSSLPITGDFENYHLALVDSYEKGILQAINIINQL